MRDQTELLVECFGADEAFVEQLRLVEDVKSLVLNQAVPAGQCDAAILAVQAVKFKKLFF